MRLMLADEILLQEWMVQRKHESQLRYSQIASVESSAWGSRWQAIKNAAEGEEFERRGKVALVNAVGVLDYKYDIWAYIFDSSCYAGITNKVEAAARDSGIEKIILYIDSPGGYSAGLQEAADAIHAARGVKEVVAVVDPSAYSAGYWLASQCTRIVSIASGGVGSLGSQTIYFSQYRWMQEMGLDVEVIRAAISPNKNTGHPYEAPSDEGRKERQEAVDYMGQLFVKHVARGRGVDESVVLEKFGQGKTYFAPQAIDRGMIDSIGSLADEVTEEATATRSQLQPQQTVSARHLI